MTSTPDEPIAAAILELVAARGAAKSICPSEAAQALGGENWRPLMSAVRATAVSLALAGRIDILRKGKPVDPRDFRGVYRLRIKPEGSDDASAP